MQQFERSLDMHLVCTSGVWRNALDVIGRRENVRQTIMDTGLKTGFDHRHFEQVVVVPTHSDNTLYL